MTDDRGRPWRWGDPLSFAEAEALSRRWAEGDLISEHERWLRHKDEIIELVQAEIAAGSYSQLNEVRAWMVAQGLTELTEEADPNLVAQTLCEHMCALEVAAKGLKGPDMDAAYWDCMAECAPVQYPETKDPAHPLYPHSQEPTADELTTTFSLPPKVDEEQE